MGDKRAKVSSSKRAPIRTFLLGLSGFAAAFLTYAYQAQPDDLAGLTIVPACIWIIPGILSILWFSGRGRKMLAFTVFALWALFTTTSVEEVWSLARRDKFPTSTWQAARNEGKTIRIASLDCVDSQTQAAAEVKTLDPKPDIILLQKSPSQEELQKLATELFGGEGAVMWSTDTSIIVHGKVTPKTTDPNSLFVHGTVDLSTGKQIEVIDVCLLPAVIRYDFWSRDFWRAHRDARRERRKQIDSIIKEMNTVPATTPLVVGGNFNCAVEDGSLLPLRVGLREAFRTSGRGNCNTITNRYPVERVDQIWVTDTLQPEWFAATKTSSSNHRLVVSDFSIR
nr:hypothetical protein [uncultured bacterium]